MEGSASLEVAILMLICIGWFVLIVVVDSPWLTARFRHWKLALLVLALLLFLMRGTTSALPPRRPADFAVHYHAYTSFGQSLTTIDISATTCRYQLTWTSRYSQSAPVDTSCVATDADLDTLYSVVRSQRFDQIRYYGFPDVVLASDSGGEFYITVTANATTYRKDDPASHMVFSGEQQWAAVDGAIRDLIWSKTRPTPAGSARQPAR